jgi:MoxR-like ATPase
MNSRDLTESLDYMFAAQLTPFIWGRAGIGKTSIVKQYAKTKGYKFFAFYLGTQSDLGDILGLQEFVRDEDGNAIATKFAIPEWLANTINYCEENPESGAVIFLDEFNRARRDILSGMFSLALDKSFHTVQLPKNCHLVAAGNPPTQEYQVTDTNETALMARFVHIKLEPAFDEWVDYAKARKLEPTLVSFLQQQPELLEAKHSHFDLPIKVDRRAWERGSKLFEVGTPTPLLEQLLAGIVGLESTVAYMRYLKDCDKPLTAEAILIMDAQTQAMLEKWINPESMQASLLSISCDNLKAHIVKMDENKQLFDAALKKNLMLFLTTVPKDIIYPTVLDLVTTNSEAFRDFYEEPTYRQPILNLMRSAKGLK